MKTQITLRNILFFFSNAIVVLIYYVPMKDLIGLNDLYSHIVLIPFVSGYFILVERKKIFFSTKFSFAPGITLIIIGTILYIIGIKQGTKFNQNDYYSIMSLAILIIWMGVFILFYGIQAFRNASFQIKFLILMIPIPIMLVDKIIYALQSASAEVSYAVFKVVGVPIYREGFVFHLPGVNVEVAKECSGIRSTIALFITSILAGHLFLKTGWKKAFLCLSVFPITVFKNGLRIVTLSLLGAYVDISYLTNSLIHKKGGIPFFILALLFLSPIIWLLRKSEKEEIDDKLVMTKSAKEKENINE